MYRNKFNIMFLFLSLVMVLSACSSGTSGGGTTETSSSNSGTETKSQDNKQITIKFAHHMLSSSGTAKHIKKFAELVEERTNGQVKFILYPDGQLGGEKDVDENVIQGTLQMTLISSPILGGLSPQFNLLNVPYLWKNNEYAYEQLHGEIGDQLKESLIETKGLRILTWYAEGFRNVFAKDHPIQKLEDWNGLKIRSPESEAYMQAFSALGANPTPVAYPEVYNALQTEVVTAAEAPYDSAANSKWHEVGKDVSVTEHIFVTQAIAINEKFWNTLPPEVQKVMQVSALEVSKMWLDSYPSVEKEMVEKLKAEGATIYEVSNEERARMVEAVKPVWESLGKKYQIDSLIEKMSTK